MNKNSPLLSKICQNCGLQKPLTAFLSYTDKSGALTHGNICADCRKMTVDQDTKEESTRSSTGGAGIRNNERATRQRTTETQIKDMKDLYYRGRDEKAAQAQFKVENKVETERNESMRRVSLFGGQSHDNRIKQHATPKQTQTAKQTQAQPPRKEGEASTSNMEVPKEGALKGESVQRFMDANISSPLAQALRKNPLAQALQKSPLARMFEQSIQKMTKQAPTDPKKPSETPVTDHINRTWRKR